MLGVLGALPASGTTAPRDHDGQAAPERTTSAWKIQRASLRV